MSIGIAILGAGDFARDEHLPAIQACPLLTLKAVYSRSKTAARKISHAEDVDWYYDHPSTPLYSLTDLLAREDIHAVIIAVPLFVQTAYIKKVLTAGKHVLSEKPIAEDVKTAEGLIEWYRSVRRKEIWSVAENFRFLPGIILASDQLRKLGGTVTSFDLHLYGFIGHNEQSDDSPVKQVTGDQSIILIDSGVHFAAGLRSLLQAARQEVSSLTASTFLASPCLSSADTIQSTLQLRNGYSGTFNIQFGSGSETAFSIKVITDQGSVTVRADHVVYIVKDNYGNRVEETTEVGFDNGVKAEVHAFAQSIVSGVANERGAPEEALSDLKLIQRMLESGEQGGAVKVIL